MVLRRKWLYILHEIAYNLRITRYEAICIQAILPFYPSIPFLYKISDLETESNGQLVITFGKMSSF